MKSKICSPVMLVFLGALTALSGCAHEKKRYDYKTIQQEYAELTCNLPPVEPADGDAQVCVIDGPITIDNAIKIARANNPDMLMAVARIRKAESMLEQAKVPYYPGIDFYTEYLQGDAPSAYLFKSIDARKLPPGTDFNDPGWFENYESGVTARLNLYNGGRDTLNKKMAEIDLTVSELDRQAVDNTLTASVIQTYFDTLAAAQFIRTAEESVATVESQLRIMTVRYKSGGALRSDILSLEVRLAEAKEAVVQSRNRHRIALAALANILGVNPDTPLQVSDERFDAPDIPADYTQGIGHALLRRPELAKIREQLRQSRMAVDAARSGYLPKIDLQARYYMDDPKMDYDRDRENWTAGVYFNWTLFNGFSTKWDTRRANAVLEEMIAADRKTTLSVKFDVKKSYLNLDEAEQRYQVAQSNVDRAEESLSLVKKQYEGGSATITRYLETELSRNRARISATAAYYDKQKALADICRAIGYWSKEPNTEQPQESQRHEEQ